MEKFCVRRSVTGSDRKSSSYLIEGSSGYRFSKTAVSNAVEFKTTKEASNALRKVKTKDPNHEYAIYDICEIVAI